MENSGRIFALNQTRAKKNTHTQFHSFIAKAFRATKENIPVILVAACEFAL